MKCPICSAPMSVVYEEIDLREWHCQNPECPQHEHDLVEMKEHVFLEEDEVGETVAEPE